MMTFGALLGSLELGMIYAVLALGVFLSFRTLNMPDLTVDGSIVTGMAISAVICAGGGHPLLALLGAFAGGCLAGLLTGLLHTRLKIQAILAGILVMMASYSVNLRIMGKTPNIPLTKSETIYKIADRLLPPQYAGMVLNLVLLAVIILLDQNGCRRSLGDEAEGAVSIHSDDDGDHITHLVLGTLVELLGECHDVDTLLTQSRANRGSRSCLAGLDLQLNVASNFLCHNKCTSKNLW